MVQFFSLIYVDILVCQTLTNRDFVVSECAIFVFQVSTLVFH